MTMQVLMLRNRMVDGALLASGSTYTVADDDGAYLVANEWATRTDGVPDRVITSDVSVPTIDPTTGALINPTTGEELVPIVITGREIVPVSGGVANSLLSAAASLSATTGAIGTLASSETVAGAVVKLYCAEFLGGARGITLSLSDYSSLACGNLLYCFAPDQATAANWIVNHAGPVYEMQPGTSTDRYFTSLEKMFLAFAFASGSGYTGASVNLVGYA